MDECRPFAFDVFSLIRITSLLSNMNEQDNDTREMLHPSPSGEGLRWRAWPCPECSGGFSPIGVLIRRAEAGAAILRGSPEQIAERQVALLQEWVGCCEHTTESVLSLPKIAEGSEHVVYLREADACVFKVTKRGTFGESYFLKNNLVHRAIVRLWIISFGCGFGARSSVQRQLIWE